MNRSRLIALYRGVRYHLKECFVRPPENAKELFNLRHASLRTVVKTYVIHLLGTYITILCN